MIDRTAALVELIYSGLEEPSAWTSFLKRFLAELPASTVVLGIHYPSHPELSVTAYAGKDDDYWQEITKWVHQEPWMSRLPLSTLRPGDLRLSHHLCPDSELEATQIYREFLAPHDLHYGGGLILSPGNSQFATMSCLRPKSEGPLTDSECEFWLELAPHLVRTTRLHDAQTRMAVERDLLLAHFDDAGTGLVMVNPGGRILLANSRAEAALGAADGLSRVDGSLHASSTKDDRRLHAAIRRLATGAEVKSKIEPEQDVSILITRRCGPPLLLLLSTPRPAAPPVLTGSPVAIRIVDPAASRMIDTEPLRQLFGLSEAEARVVSMLAKGLRVKDVTEALHISVNTARTHLSRSLAKTGTTNQAQLISLAMRTAISPAREPV